MIGLGWREGSTFPGIVPHPFPDGFESHPCLTRTQIRQVRDLIADLNTSVRNKFRTDPEVLAEWSTASRIHRTGRRRNDDAPPPQPPVV